MPDKVHVKKASTWNPRLPIATKRIDSNAGGPSNVRSQAPSQATNGLSSVGLTLWKSAAEGNMPRPPSPSYDPTVFASIVGSDTIETDPGWNEDPEPKDVNGITVTTGQN